MIKNEDKSIKCRCGNYIRTTENPQIAICSICNRRYGRQTPKLKLLDAEDVISDGVIIT